MLWTTRPNHVSYHQSVGYPSSSAVNQNQSGETETVSRTTYWKKSRTTSEPTPIRTLMDDLQPAIHSHQANSRQSQTSRQMGWLIGRTKDEWGTKWWSKLPKRGKVGPIYKRSKIKIDTSFIISSLPVSCPSAGSFTQSPLSNDPKHLLSLGPYGGGLWDCWTNILLIYHHFTKG